MERTEEREARKIMRVPLNASSRVGKVIGVLSGKGGVGKSLVAAMLATALNRKGYATAVLDADITGPSIPKIFGLKQKAAGNEEGLLPAESRTGIKIMSINLLLPNATDPVIWRGPILAGIIKQFWSDVVWGEVDYLLIDMPPGTGDVPLTVFQSLPVDGIVIVTSPQELVSDIVTKAVKMARLMDIHILGLVENMAYYQCPHCGEEANIFGDSCAKAAAAEHGLDVLARLPLDSEIARACDRGAIEDMQGSWLEEVVRRMEEMDEKAL